MKTALFMNDERVQVVLTPESDYERQILKALTDKQYELHTYQAQFTEVQGGWTKFESMGYRGATNDSTIIVLDRRAPEPSIETRKRSLKKEEF